MYQEKIKKKVVSALGSENQGNYTSKTEFFEDSWEIQIWCREGKWTDEPGFCPWFVYKTKRVMIESGATIKMNHTEQKRKKKKKEIHFFNA